MPYADVNDIRMYYEEMGDPAVPAMVLPGKIRYEVIAGDVAPFSHPWIVGPQVLDFLERNSSALSDVSRP